MLAAGAAYVIDTTAHALLGNYTDYETAFTTMVAVPSIIGEGWFGLWLLLRAGKNQPALAPTTHPTISDQQLPVTTDKVKS